MQSLFAKRDFSASRRRRLAHTGAAMPGGRFPIESEEDLQNAVRLMHHASDISAVRAHIKSRARAIGASDPLEKAWSDAARIAALAAREGLHLPGDLGATAGHRLGRRAGGAAGRKLAVMRFGQAARKLPEGVVPHPSMKLNNLEGDLHEAIGQLTGAVGGATVGRYVGTAAIPAAAGYGAYRALKKDWAQFDEQRGAGERTGRVGGLAFGIFHAPHVGRAVGHALIRRGFRVAPAIGAGVVAGYGAVRGAQAVGGYVGRKVDDTLSGIFR